MTIYSVFTSVLITSAGDFRRDSDQLFDKTEKDYESGSEFLLMTSTACNRKLTIANFFSQSGVYRSKTTCNTTQRFQNLIKTKMEKIRTRKSADNNSILLVQGHRMMWLVNNYPAKSRGISSDT